MKLNIFDPAQRAELIEVCSILASVTSMTPPQIFLAYTAYGDMFDWNIGKVLDNVDNVQGKLCLKPQAMLGNAYRLGLILSHTKSFDAESGVMTMTSYRADNPSEQPCISRYTVAQAEAAGYLTRRSWKTQFENMMWWRCCANHLRMFYPDAAAGQYMTDEIADNSSLSEDEHYKQSMQALGEDV